MLVLVRLTLQQLLEGYANKAIFLGKFIHLHLNFVWLQKKIASALRTTPTYSHRKHLIASK